MISGSPIFGLFFLAAASLGTTLCVGACGSGVDDDDKEGPTELVCTVNAPPSLSCRNDDQEAETGARCTAEADEGGCPNLTVTWSCENGEGGVSWARREDTHCDCNAQATPDACGSLPGCGWVDTSVACPDDPMLQPITAEGCYTLHCGYSAFGSVGGECRYDVCAGTPDATSSSGGQGGGGGEAGSGGSGGGDPVTCTTDEPPAEGCAGDGFGGPTDGHCEVELEGGCPTTTVAWACVNGEGGFGWERTENTHCDCTGDGVDEPSCSALPGCAWAAPDPVTCDVQEGGNLIEGEGCYRTHCGFGGWGVVEGVCRYDLCRSDE